MAYCCYEPAHLLARLSLAVASATLYLAAHYTACPHCSGFECCNNQHYNLVLPSLRHLSLDFEVCKGKHTLLTASPVSPVWLVLQALPVLHNRHRLRDRECWGHKCWARLNFVQLHLSLSRWKKAGPLQTRMQYSENPVS